MASGKKCKKSKGKTLALNEFLLDSSGSNPGLIRKMTTSTSWADEVEDTYHSYEPKPSVVLPTAPKAAREVEEFCNSIPFQPPFTAYLSNLPYDTNEREIAKFFGNLKISSMRVPKDERSRDTAKVKGFGYIEFDTREDLLIALSMQNRTMKHRRIKIELASNVQEKTKDRSYAPQNRSISEKYQSSKDWRRETREFSRSDKHNHGNHSSQWHSEKFVSNYGDQKMVQAGPIPREKQGKKKSENYTKGKNFAGNSNDDHPRPKLQLAPRTKPTNENILSRGGKSEATESIFGKAKPVDTSIRERQIEERLAKERELYQYPSPKKRGSYNKQNKYSFTRTYSAKKSSPTKIAYTVQAGKNQVPRISSGRRVTSGRVRTNAKQCAEMYREDDEKICE